LANRTQIFIRIKPEKVDAIRDAIANDEGYLSVKDMGGDGDYRQVYIIYTRNFGYLDKREFKKLVGVFEGKVVRVRRLGHTQFMSQRVKIMLRDASIVSTLTFLTSLTASKALTSLELNSMLTVAVIPALTSFFTKISLDLRISFPTQKQEGE
jgi:hypothetical protein